MRMQITMALGLGLALLAGSGCQGLMSGGDELGGVDSGAADVDSAVMADAAAAAADAVPGAADAASTPEPDAAPQPIDCSAIDADPDYELCESDATSCAGVFTDGSGCINFCAAAGLVCSARYGGEPGCQKEPANVLNCFDSNGHASDWCECEASGGGGGGGGDCEVDPGNPPVVMEIGKDAATYTERNNWVLGCYPYAYTAGSTEHQACDNQYFPDGSRTGTATFSFAAVPSGSYDVYIYGRHTENRNSSGALFYVDGHAAVIMQNDDADYVWDFHGTYCLDGAVDVILDSSVNSGSDSVATVRLTPTP